jgi:hypothetical protein
MKIIAQEIHNAILSSGEFSDRDKTTHEGSMNLVTYSRGSRYAQRGIESLRYPLEGHSVKKEPSK